MFPQYEVERSMDRFAPIMARMHGYKMSEASFAVFCDWLEENEEADVLEYAQKNSAVFTRDPIKQLKGYEDDFPEMWRVDEYHINYVQPLFWGRFRVVSGPIADAHVGGNAWADYANFESAKAATRKWNGQSSPPAEGLIRHQIHDGPIVRNKQPVHLGNG